MSSKSASWLKPFGATVWHEFSPLSQKYKAVNLGQGFPNWTPPPFLLEAAQQALVAQTPNLDAGAGKLINQYARPSGHVRLVTALSDLYSPLVGRKIDALTEFQVTSGASEGIASTIAALVDPGDEVIVFAPYFDLYEGAIAQAGATLVQVNMELPRDATSSAAYTIDIPALKAALTPKTKLILMNNPHNPSGKMFTREELTAVAEVIQSYGDRILVASDEVYEFITYGEEFVRMCTIPGMWERTVTISSASKTFSVTGWKIGWCYGPSDLIDCIARAHQFCSFSIATPLQEAVAVALVEAQKNNYFPELLESYGRKRELLLKTLRGAGFKPVVPQGSFFILCNIDDRELEEGQGTDKSLTGLFLDAKDWNFCRWLTTEVGVAAIPCSAFYYGDKKSHSWIRFAFCKEDEELIAAADLLKKALVKE
eukprot:TRINITY_DN3164_c0_g1_i1.p1 TRINITY_DN3164_c0_g1~~TRINITY_DN3164_c0_g1_i1.p1  ORF type:complete len:426 (-),score=106.08 TRINITY_DN3164_c0_g1_i1:46-1323(-)